LLRKGVALAGQKQAQQLRAELPVGIVLVAFLFVARAATVNLLEERHGRGAIQFARESFNKRAYGARPRISNLLARKSGAGLKTDEEIPNLIGIHQFADDEHVDLFRLEFISEPIIQF
jgi:hypothetical protein